MGHAKKTAAASIVIGASIVVVAAISARQSGIPSVSSLASSDTNSASPVIMTATSTPQATTSTPEAASGWRMPYRLEYSVDESYVLAEAVIAELYEERYATESGAMPDTFPPNDDALTHWLDGGGWHKYRAVRLDITRPLYPPDYSGSGFIVTQSLDRYAVPESVAETAGLGVFDNTVKRLFYNTDTAGGQPDGFVSVLPLNSQTHDYGPAVDDYLRSLESDLNAAGASYEVAGLADWYEYADGEATSLLAGRTYPISQLILEAFTTLGQPTPTALPSPTP